MYKKISSQDKKSIDLRAGGHCDEPRRKRSELGTAKRILGWTSRMPWIPPLSSQTRRQRNFFGQEIEPMQKKRITLFSYKNGHQLF